jgi:hypothetical protein
VGSRKRRALAGIALGFIATGDYLHNIVLGARALKGEATKRSSTPAASPQPGVMHGVALQPA